jgi:hypothetical protein
MLIRSLYFVPLCLMVLVVASVTGQSPLTCPAPGDEAYGNKPDLDALNDVACNMTNTVAFTSLLTDSTGVQSCTTYCASCEADICDLSFGDEPAMTCSDPSKCTMCDEPLGCSTGTATPPAAQSPLTCPAPGDAAYGNKPDLDGLNDAACGLDDTLVFTWLIIDRTGSSNCTTYCASCEADICRIDGDKGIVTCSDPSKCTVCEEPPGCSTRGTSSARKTAVATMAAFAVVATMFY